MGVGVGVSLDGQYELSYVDYDVILAKGVLDQAAGELVRSLGFSDEEKMIQGWVGVQVVARTRDLPL